MSSQWIGVLAGFIGIVTIIFVVYTFLHSLWSK